MSFRPIWGTPRLTTHDWGEEQHERETHWTSLFYDLMVVAALNAIAEPFEELEEGEEGEGSMAMLTPIRLLWLDALLQFVSVINSWNTLNFFTCLLEDESFVGHLSFFFHAFGMAATTAGCVGDFSENYRVLATGVILAKLGLVVLFARPVLYIPRVRLTAAFVCIPFLVNIALMLLGLYMDSFDKFRVVLIIATLFDWVSLLFISQLKQHQRVPMHIQSYTDRIKEVTMVIFGEAIFAIILQPYKDAQPETHFYLALALTLWVIYSMTLQEFHILPSPDDHALRRSMLFGYLWYYTQFAKQIFLLGASIGIKRAHLLMFVAPTEPIDRDTRRLTVWGQSLIMVSVVLIRSYSFGFGRHPNSEDPPAIWYLKAGWWAFMAFASMLPQLIDQTIFEYVSCTPMVVMACVGVMLFFIIIVEAALSNLVASQYKTLMEKAGMSQDDVGELTYLSHKTSSSIKTYSANENDEVSSDKAKSSA
mmetsp:Transcript_5766/g.12672  ORF Transcript_5766/g.12672 Transcript_5766/m.12672 type:complete len:478 (+) Transcript_5766:110-1543(+)